MKRFYFSLAIFSGLYFIFWLCNGYPSYLFVAGLAASLLLAVVLVRSRSPKIIHGSFILFALMMGCIGYSSWEFYRVREAITFIVEDDFRGAFFLVNDPEKKQEISSDAHNSMEVSIPHDGLVFVSPQLLEGWHAIRVVTKSGKEARNEFGSNLHTGFRFRGGSSGYFGGIQGTVFYVGEQDKELVEKEGQFLRFKQLIWKRGSKVNGAS